MMDLNESLYLEHLEEISILYDQQSQMPEPDEDNQARTQAHLDALMIGGDKAVSVCLARIEQGDAGELYGALRILCRHKEAATVTDIVEAITDEDRKNAALAALQMEHQSFIGRLEA